MFDIVKREHIRQPSLLVSATSDGVTAPLDRMCSASIKVFGEIRRQVFLIVCVARVPPEPKGWRTSIMRAIKCLKSIRWMPWR